MFKPVRVVATVVLVITIGFTFISAFVIKSALICLIMVIVEYLAYLWSVHRDLFTNRAVTDGLGSKLKVLSVLHTIRPRCRVELDAESSAMGMMCGCIQLVLKQCLGHSLYTSPVTYSLRSRFKPRPT